MGYNNSVVAESGEKWGITKTPMFIGEYQHTIDDKGRVAVPVKFRKFLAKGAVVTKGLDNCLVLYTMDEWKKLATRLSALPMTSANTRAFSRLMLAGAMDVSLDSQGRIILPDYLRSYASMQKKVVLAGLYNRMELWDQTQWEEFKTKSEKSSNEIAEKLSELGV